MMKNFSKLFFTAFLICCQAFICALPSYSQDVTYNPYFVEDVEVNVVAKTPAEARNLAVKTARKDAFLILLTRLSVDSKVFTRVTDDEIIDMVRSEQVFDEKVAGAAYSGRFNVTFAKDFVDYVLAQKNYKIAAASEDYVQKSVYLLIPVKILKKKSLVWEDTNDWRKYLEKAFKTNKNSDFKIPDVNVSDLSILNTEAISNMSAEDIDTVLTKYKGDMLYVVSYSYDDLQNKAFVYIRGYNRFSNKKQWKLSFVNSNHLEDDDLLKIVASKTSDYLANLSKAAKQELNPEVLNIEIEIKNLNNWLVIKDKLERSGLIDKMDIEAISRDYARVSVSYTDSTIPAVEAFHRIGLDLIKKMDGNYLLRLN